MRRTKPNPYAVRRTYMWLDKKWRPNANFFKVSDIEPEEKYPTGSGSCCVEEPGPPETRLDIGLQETGYGRVGALFSPAGAEPLAPVFLYLPQRQTTLGDLFRSSVVGHIPLSSLVTSATSIS